MDTLAFWLPLLLLFITALLGTALKRKARDHCLKKFEASKVIVPLNDESWEKGILYVFAQGLELIYENPLLSPVAKISSRVLHPSEVCKIPYFIRPAPDADTRSGYRWWKELENPILSDKARRTSLNFYNMLRDAFGQASQVIVGAISKDTSLAKIKNSDKRMNELKSGLGELVPNAWEPVLEKYRGAEIVVERKTAKGMIKESGILEDYSAQYILVREVEVNDPVLLKYFKSASVKEKKKHDLLYNRSLSILRHRVAS